MTLLIEVRSQLCVAAERRARSRRVRLLTALRRPAWPARWRGTPLIAVAVALVSTGGALAATGVFHIPAPWASTSALSTPHRDLGVLIPGTVRLLPLRAADPAGGPAWGIRVLSTRRGFGCIQVGRIENGRFGGLFANGPGDAIRFHALPISAFAATIGQQCAALDSRGRLFLNVETGFTPDESDCAFRKCAIGDLPVLWYGLLGPNAKSITYTFDGRPHTQATFGPEGAYLMVDGLASVPEAAGPPGTGPLLNFSALPAHTPITTITYRDGRVCHLFGPDHGRYSPSCFTDGHPDGYVPVAAPALTDAQVASTLHGRELLLAEGGREIIVSFTSRIAVVGARSDYLVKFHVPGMPARDIGYGGGVSQFQSDIAAGQTVTMRFLPFPWVPQAAGVFRVWVIYQRKAGLTPVSLPVGSFTIAIPHASESHAGPRTSYGPQAARAPMLFVMGTPPRGLLRQFGAR
ncbi:MAG: hypothetical protein ABSG64_10675 [Solirubrobacteraceae bacterium]|jgi:hypothetical protein